MPYVVKEIYRTLQGEGANTGRAAVFLRFTGCNLWSGRDEDRAKGGSCARWCDTDFLGTDGPGGGRFDSAKDLALAVAAEWPSLMTGARPFVVATGGEPLLQLDEPAIRALHEAGFEIAIETNGMLPVPPGVDWVCVSPKAGADLVVKKGNELKLIYPQLGADPSTFERLEFQYFYLQPMDGPDRERNTHLAANYCLAHPPWRLSLQTHKIVGLR